jgi:hypothetical protein
LINTQHDLGVDDAFVPFERSPLSAIAAGSRKGELSCEGAVKLLSLEPTQEDRERRQWECIDP